MRYRATLATSSLCLLLTSFAFADELTPGKYSGSMQITQGTVHIVLDITSVENCTVQGGASGRARINRGSDSRWGASAVFR